MKKVKIYTDSSCDLPNYLLDKFDIDVIPLVIRLDNAVFDDVEGIKPDQIYNWMENTGHTPRTSEPDVESVFRKLLSYDEEGQEIVYVGVSEKFSKTASIIREAGNSLKHARVFVVDTMNVSGAVGLLALKGAMMSETGKNGMAIEAVLNLAKKRVKMSYVTDNITSLSRMDWCQTKGNFFTNTFRFKHEVCMEKGQMYVKKRYGGGAHAVYRAYTNEVVRQIKDVEEDYCLIVHTGCDQKQLEEIRVRLAALPYFKHVEVVLANGASSCYCDEKSIGIMYIDNQDENSKPNIKDKLRY